MFSTLQIHRMARNKNQKLLLFTLKEMGAEVEPVPITLDKLAEFTGTARLTVNKQLIMLKEDGLITVVAGKGKAPNTYRLNIEN